MGEIFADAPRWAVRDQAVRQAGARACAFGVNHHWPEGARSFTTVGCSANFVSSAGEGEIVMATASPLHTGRTTQVWDATVMNETTEKLMASYRCTQLILY
ncbi:MAG TPA: PaaI family thioesterase [Acidimicrobiales bacterium]|nr:PaaI family thioesterase [Acidimicrobiales bacterium]